MRQIQERLVDSLEAHALDLVQQQGEHDRHREAEQRASPLRSSVLRTARAKSGLAKISRNTSKPAHSLPQNPLAIL